MRGQALTDTQLLLDLVGEAYSFEDLAQYRDGILGLITRVVPCDRVGYNEITPEESFAITVPDFDPKLLPRFAALIYENPLIERYERTRDGRPYRISDLIDQPTFHRLALYQEFYRQIGVEWQVAFTLPARAPLIVGVALTRTRQDFTDREVQLLAFARPHLMHACRNAELHSARNAMLAALEQGLDTLGQRIIVLDAHGRIEFATDSARRLLSDSKANPRGLPDEIRAWLANQRDPRSAVGDAIALIGGVVWCVLVAGYLRQGPRRLVTDARDTAAGPLLAAAVMSALLLGVVLSEHARTAGHVVVIVFLAIGALVSGLLLGRWQTGGLEQDRLGPAIYLPGGGIGWVGTQAADAIGLHHLAAVFFGIGVFTWVFVSSIVLNRFLYRPRLTQS
jgi:GAF domain-containing protein